MHRSTLFLALALAFSTQPKLPTTVKLQLPPLIKKPTVARRKAVRI